MPDLASAARDPLARLCALVDVLYDRDQPLDVHARSAADRMLEAKAPPSDAARALSRLAVLRTAPP